MCTQAAIRYAFEGRAIFRHGDLIELGFTRRSLAAALEDGVIRRHSRGIYFRAGAETHDMFDVALAAAIADGVVWGRTAATYHGLTDDIPGHIHVVIPYGRRSDLEFGGLRVRVRRSDRDVAFLDGIETAGGEGVTFRVTDRARTVAEMMGAATDDQHQVAAVSSYVAQGGDLAALLEAGRRYGGITRLTPIVEGVLAGLELGVSRSI